ncbi:unnamed protein product, partial [Closterium sp. Naga37s-1]
MLVVPSSHLSPSTFLFTTLLHPSFSQLSFSSSLPFSVSLSFPRLSPHFPFATWQSLDDGDEFRLPIDHRITENLDREGLERRWTSRSLAAFWINEFRLPIDHRITENLDREGLEMASLDKPIACSNVGFQLLLKMGWRGKGLGRNEQGERDRSERGNVGGRMKMGSKGRGEAHCVQQRGLPAAAEDGMAGKGLGRNEQGERDSNERRNVGERIKWEAREEGKLIACSGFQLLLKMGWRGKGLGRNEQRIVDPVRTEMRGAFRVVSELTSNPTPPLSAPGTNAHTLQA